MYILGIATVGKERAVALLDDGRLIAAATSESSPTPAHAEPWIVGWPELLNRCLQQAGINLSACDHIAVAKPAPQVGPASPIVRARRMLRSRRSGVLRGSRPSDAIGDRADALRDENIMVSLTTCSQLPAEKICQRIAQHDFASARAASAFNESSFGHALCVSFPSRASREPCVVHLCSSSETRHVRSIAWQETAAPLAWAIMQCLETHPLARDVDFASLATQGQPRYAASLLESVVKITPDGRCLYSRSFIDTSRDTRMVRPALRKLLERRLRGDRAASPESTFADLAASALQVGEAWASTLLSHFTLAYAERTVCLVGDLLPTTGLVARLQANGTLGKAAINRSQPASAASIGAALATYNTSVQQLRLAPASVDQDRVGPAEK